MRREWFRRGTWSADDAADFAKRLQRTRSLSMKAQYLRIQASHLEAIGTPELLQAALGLLDRLVKEAPDPMQLVLAHEARASCLARLRGSDEALDAYRDSFAAQRALPSVHANAYLGFGELVLGLARADLYDEVLHVFAEFGGGEVFPVHQYRFAVVLACIADVRGDRPMARKHAQDALAAAARTESPFRYHRELGLVGLLAPDIEAKIKRLASM